MHSEQFAGCTIFSASRTSEVITDAKDQQVTDWKVLFESHVGVYFETKKPD